MDEFYATKGDSGYNFIVIQKKRGKKYIKNCIKYISMECLLFTFYIFEMYKEKIINCNNLTEFVNTET